jgi:hypothetical protein
MVVVELEELVDLNKTKTNLFDLGLRGEDKSYLKMVRIGFNIHKMFDISFLFLFTNSIIMRELDGHSLASPLVEYY